MMFKLLRENEVILHAFVCLSNEGGELIANGSKIIEGVQVVDDEGSANLSALKFFLPKIEPASPTEFMRYSAGDGIRVYVG
jgi:hypothetical protein